MVEQSKELIVYLTMPYLSPTGDMYPILPQGYNIRHLPPEVMNFPHKKIVGSKEELDKFIAGERKKQKLKDRDLRAEVDIDTPETSKLKEEVSELKNQNKSLQESMNKILEQMQALQSQLKPSSTQSKATKKEEKT